MDPPDGGADTMYRHAGLTPETTYYYRVRGVNATGAGEWSEVASATVYTPAGGAPSIMGTAQVGETLKADTSGIADANGLTNVSYSY